MADFRRWITALALLALCVGIASAQTSTQSQMVCNSVAQVTPALRSEGVTELVGDIVITCTGGQVYSNTSSIPAVNIIVNVTGTNAITSRLISGGNVSSTLPSGTSEVLLMIDEPNSTLTPIANNYGPAAPLKVCPTPLTGCPEVVASAPVANPPAGWTGANIQVAQNPDGTSPYNVFQGVVNGTQVSFTGVPILPPGTSGIQRVIRITNIRINAAGAGGSSIGAFISASPFSSLPISNPNVTVGFITKSLSTSVTKDVAGTVVTTTNQATFNQCNVNMGSLKNNTSPNANVGILNYSELFPGAFKTRVNSASNNSVTGGSSYTGTSSANSYTQNVPGTLYYSESGFTMTANTVNAGLADYGTRFQAVFSGIPTGATLYVSRYNVTAFSTSANSLVTKVGDSSITSVAAYTTSTNGGAFADPSGPGSTTTAYGGITVVPVGSNNTAVWEVTNTNPNGVETFSFAVFIAYTPNPATNAPAPGNVTVTLSYNPIDANPGTLPGTPNTIPRFINTSTAQPLLGIVQCQTALLFPYVTSSGGFDTGIAISNTSLDPLSPTTGSSQGTCTLNFYGAGVPTALASGLVVPTSAYSMYVFANGTASTPVANPTNIPAGGQLVFSMTSIAQSFQGYMFALCNFQFAHGFAFVSDVGAKQLAMGYLALVVNNGWNIYRSGSTAYSAETLTQ